MRNEFLFRFLVCAPCAFMVSAVAAIVCLRGWP